MNTETNAIAARDIAKNFNAPGCCDDILDRLNAFRWVGGETLSCIKYAGTIDNGDENKIHGHNGYWIATEDGCIAYITNGDPVWADWSEDVAGDCGLVWGDFVEAMIGHEVV